MLGKFDVLEHIEYECPICHYKSKNRKDIEYCIDTHSKLPEFMRIFNEVLRHNGRDIVNPYYRLRESIEFNDKDYPISWNTCDIRSTLCEYKILYERGLERVTRMLNSLNDYLVQGEKELLADFAQTDACNKIKD